MPNSNKRMGDQLQARSKKLMKISENKKEEEKIHKNTSKAEITAGNMECAQVYARRSLGNKNESVIYANLSDQLDSSSSQLKLLQCVKTELKAGSKECARVFAHSALRNKKRSVFYAKLSDQLDSSSSQLQLAECVKKVKRDVTSAYIAGEDVLKSIDPNKTSVVPNLDSRDDNLDTPVDSTSLMANIEKQGKDLDSLVEVLTGYATPSTISSQQVDRFIQELAEENGLHIFDQWAQAESFPTG